LLCGLQPKSDCQLTYPVGVIDFQAALHRQK
jgi:hypothetical protein